MSGGGLVEVLARHAWGDDTAQMGHHAVQCSCGWVDYEPSGDIYGLRARHDKHRADVVTAHLAARLEGCRFEVRGAVVAHNEAFARSWAITEAALAVVREALNVAPEPPASRSDGRTGRDGTSMQGERAGDGG